MKEPIFVTQLDFFGNEEKIDISRFRVKIPCSHKDCLNIRYILPQDKNQVRYCKPHTKVLRDEKKARKARERRAKAI